MAGSHSFTLGDQLVERLLRDSRPSSRCNSPALSRCSSNRGSIYSEESTEPSIRESEENLDYNEREEDGQEDSNQLTISNVCSTCKEENQIRQALSVQQARQRSYLHGSVGPFQSLLGHSELKRTLPDCQLKIFVGSWNMNGKTPPSLLEDLLLPTPLQSMPDVVVIGTQETNGDREEWEISLQETLGPGHVLFDSVELGTLHMAVFLRRDLIWVCSVPESDSHSTRAGRAFRTKGGVAIGFSMFGTSLLFVNCHLTAHAEKVAERERDIKKIFHSLELPQELPIRRKHKDVTNNYDVVFLCGDLNFRLNKSREDVIDIVAKLFTDRPQNNVGPSLLESDQLKNSIKQNRLLKSFKEADINFPPTYKYIPGSSEFDDSTKQRVPSYTDRILWKEKKGDSVTCDYYDSVTQLKSSDHFPVWAAFQVPMRAGRETIPLSAGTFNRTVYLEGMKRRVQAWDPHKRRSRHSCNLQ